MTYWRILGLIFPVIVNGSIFVLYESPDSGLMIRGRIGDRAEHGLFQFDTTSRGTVIEQSFSVDDARPNSITLLPGDWNVEPFVLRELPGHSFIPSMLEGFGGMLGAGLGSIFANTVSSIMIVSSHSSLGPLHLILSPVAPQDHCIERSITRIPAQYSDNLGVMTVGISVSLIFAQTGLSYVGNTSTVMEQFIVSTTHRFDYVPRDIARHLGDIVTLFRGTSSTCTHIMDLLPSIQYTISGRVSVVLSAHDYLTESCELKIGASRGGQNILGINFLKHVAVLIDYTTHQFGFCDPI